MQNCQEQSQWREYVKTRSPQLREAIIREHAVLAKRAVERLQISPWGCVSNDDLLSYAIMGLLDAIDRYDPDHGTPFEGFAMPRIRGSVLDALRRLDWVPRSVRSEESRLRKAHGNMEMVLNRPPTNAEVAAHMGISTDELEGLVTEVARSSVMSLDDLVAGMDDSTVLGDMTLGSEELDPYRDQERQDARSRLADAIGGLPEREKLVVSLYYYEELTLKEIGRVLGVTEQRVSQIHARAMLRMSHKLMRHRDLLMCLAA
jgi:RNA polymerase sigma factor for flagellar operon FliA